MRVIAPDGVNCVAEVDFADHIELDAVHNHRSRRCHQLLLLLGRRPTIPYWALGFADVTLRLLGSDDFAPAVKADAAAQLTEALVDGSLRVPVTERLPLGDVAQAHGAR